MKDDVQLFVEKNFASAFKAFKQTELGQSISSLSDYQKTLIYYYTCNFHEQLNEALFDGHPNDRFSKYRDYLDEALNKLPDFVGRVYRGVELTKNQIDRYKKAFDDKEYVIEPAFTSASTSILVAQIYSKGKVIFQIGSLHGKLIEDVSYYGGGNDANNEKEVLFKSSTKFNVVKIETKPNGLTLIILKEIEYHETI